MRCREWIEIFEKLAPEKLACDWDNPGLQVGRQEKEIETILVALDATDAVIEQAVAEQADLLVTHHPLIFKPVKQVNDGNFITRRIVKLLQADICCFAMHTNFDAAPGCMADLAAERLKLQQAEPLEVTGEQDGEVTGIGRAGNLETPLSLSQLASQVKEAFHLPFVTVYGAEAVTEPIRRIAISPGSGGSMIGYGLRKGAQVLVTGDIGHHTGIDAAACQMAIMDAGHYGLEQIFIPFVADYIQREAGGAVKVLTATPQFPVKMM